jgi:light-regulated signal transduction histidine kinase (bacteriophytochrome)
MPSPVRPNEEAQPHLEHSKSDLDVSEFILRACHDLRAPTRAVRTQAELLLRDPEARNSAFEERLGLIIEGAGKIDLLLDGLAGYSVALQTNPASFQSAPMGVLLRSVLAKFSRDLPNSGAEVTYDDLPVVLGNPDRLMQVFENLIRNALVHRGQAAPHIHVSAVRQAEEWLFSVHDNGPGIDAAFLQKIFMPFERLHGKERPGPGLGLAVCREIVERHGGRIWAESEPGCGSTFRFTLQPQ